MVVSRVSLSPKAMRELIDAMDDNWSEWRTTEGIKGLPEIKDRPDFSSICVARAWPIRSIVGGWVPITICCQRGRSGSPTFWSVIRRSKPTIAVAAGR